MRRAALLRRVHRAGGGGDARLQRRHREVARASSARPDARGAAMTDLETRLRGDLADLAEGIRVDEQAGWEAVRERASADRAGTASLVPAPRRSRRGPLAGWAAAAAVIVVGTAAVV